MIELVLQRGARLTSTRYTPPPRTTGLACAPGRRRGAFGRTALGLLGARLVPDHAAGAAPWGSAGPANRRGRRHNICGPLRSRRSPAIAARSAARAEIARWDHLCMLCAQAGRSGGGPTSGTARCSVRPALCSWGRQDERQGAGAGRRVPGRAMDYLHASSAGGHYCALLHHTGNHRAGMHSCMRTTRALPVLARPARTTTQCCAACMQWAARTPAAERPAKHSLALVIYTSASSH